MDKGYLRIIVCFLVALAMGSCVYDFTPDSEDLQGLDKPLLVIEGDIIAGGTTEVKLEFSIPVLNNSDGGWMSVPSGTSVWVENENGEIWNGEVVADFMGGISSYLSYNRFRVNTEDIPLDGKYRLCVSVPARGEYRSAFKSVAISPQIDSVTFSIADDGKSVQFEVTTHNDAQDPLYCRWSFEENWESNAEYIARLGAKMDAGTVVLEELDDAQIRAISRCYSKGASKDIYIGNTEKLLQNVIHKARLNTITETDKRISSLYAIKVVQTAMDKEAFKYWEGIKASVDGTGGLFAPMPNEVRGNITCETYPDETVLGYINVSTASELRRFVYARELLLYKWQCKETAYPDSLWMELFAGGYVPLRYSETENGKINLSEAYWTSSSCGDCRTYSNSTRPDFWPEGR